MCESRTTQPFHQANYAPMIGGKPFYTVEERERLVEEAKLAPSPLLDDPPVRVLQGYSPPLVLTEKVVGWQQQVRQAVFDGRVIQGPIREDPEVARLIAETSMHFHQAEVDKARETIIKIDLKARS